MSSERVWLQQYTAPTKSSSFVEGFWQAALHETHGSLGEDSLDSSQFWDACLHVATETCELWLLSSPDM
jgi:hypothetical protein